MKEVLSRMMWGVVGLICLAVWMATFLMPGNSPYHVRVALMILLCAQFCFGFGINSLIVGDKKLMSIVIFLIGIPITILSWTCSDFHGFARVIRTELMWTILLIIFGGMTFSPIVYGFLGMFYFDRFYVGSKFLPPDHELHKALKSKAN